MARYVKKPREFCIICKGKIYRGGKSRGLKEKRKKSDITCRKECTRMLRDVSLYLRGPFHKRLRDLNKEISELKKELKNAKRNRKKKKQKVEAPGK